MPTPPRYVFVLTYGRSGSTLVQGLLNTLPGALVRGENDFFVLPLFRSWQTLRQVRNKQHQAAAQKGLQSAFYGLDETDPDAYAVQAGELVSRQLYGAVDPATVDVLGFKEVHWHRVRPKETGALFDFFDLAFPGVRYVVHRRDHSAVSTSGFWRRREPDEVEQALRRVEEIQAELVEQRPDQVLETQYERFTSDDRTTADAELRRLAEFAGGSCDDALLARLRETMSVGFGPRAFKGQAGRDRG